MNAKQIMAFDHVRIALFDECGKSPKSVSLGFFAIVLINNDQFFPAGVIGERDANDVVVAAGVSAPAYRKHLDLHAFQLLERQIFE